ncbi:hypothetical protein [Altericista sp. CCNU0014]|uniref:hypothetical protein n=1 Tax=Altericista sp. CCNU0014 TaxID=3082949 RepID=UPI00384FB785
MAPDLRMKYGIVLLMLAGWGAIGSGAKALPGTQQNRPLPRFSHLAQATEIQNQGSVLAFEAKTSTDELKQLQVQLKQTVVALPVENTTLASDNLGAVVLTGGNGDRQRMDAYTWTVAPNSKLYLGRSGYKSFLARYQYRKDRQSPQYTLDISCQTVGLKTQDKAACSMFGNGPLLKGEVKATGRLTLEEAPAPEETASEPLAPQTVKSQTSAAASPIPSYPGQGALVMYPSTAKAKEERYGLTRVTVSTVKNVSRLTLVANEPKAKTVVFQGQLEATKSGQILSITAVDGVPGQGKIFVGNNGLLRTTAPIFVGAEDREMTVYFRPN